MPLAIIPALSACETYLNQFHYSCSLNFTSSSSLFIFNLLWWILLMVQLYIWIHFIAPKSFQGSPIPWLLETTLLLLLLHSTDDKNSSRPPSHASTLPYHHVYESQMFKPSHMTYQRDNFSPSHGYLIEERSSWMNIWTNDFSTPDSWLSGPLISATPTTSNNKSTSLQFTLYSIILIIICYNFVLNVSSTALVKQMWKFSLQGQDGQTDRSACGVITDQQLVEFN
jgi:hypothetical protein